MTLQKAHELLRDQVEFGGSYNRNAARLIRDLDLDACFGLPPGTKFSGP